ncbi:MAG: hypothetical protein JOZ16_08560 [Methylobacteriaceae bacterium]|nr:hypothetical protein [Methylobacteriaceae bacterium]
MKLVRAILCAASLAGLPALAMAQSNGEARATAGIFTGGGLTGPAGVFAGSLFGVTGATAATPPLYEGRSVYVPPYPSSLAPGYIAPGPLYAMPENAPLQRTCRTNVYGERQCEASR